MHDEFLLIKLYLVTLFETFQGRPHLTWMVGQTSSLDVWTTLVDMFSIQSKVCVVQFRMQLNQTRKENKIVVVYFNQIESQCENGFIITFCYYLLTKQFLQSYKKVKVKKMVTKDKTSNFSVARKQYCPHICKGWC
jgi:hypothetical protein